jgi:type III secretion protein N (ATPase)
MIDNPLLSSFDHLRGRLNHLSTKTVAGRVIETVGPVVKVAMPDITVGQLCELKNGETFVCHGEVVGFDRELAVLAILGDAIGLSHKTQVFAVGSAQTIDVSDELLGRVIDGMGQIADGKGALKRKGIPRPIYANPPAPLERQLINKPMPMNIRALDSLLTIAEGQRIGVFAAAGVGKSTLLSQMVKGAECDVRVIALIGERGREVREFIEHSLGEEAMSKSIIVCATSDRSSLERARAAYMATAIAEHFRDEGKKVLLMMDSVTRFARALREIGLSAGEPPARAGFPPSVFATLPRLLERSGMGKTGSITAVYTVLVEGDDMTEPIADETRSILDGHIVLSRDLASINHYPAIDILQSTSRVMPMVTSPEHKKNAGKIRELMGAYKKTEILLKVGEYKAGSDATVDEAVKKWPLINQFLCQGQEEFTSFDESQIQLSRLSSS